MDGGPNGPNGNPPGPRDAEQANQQWLENLPISSLRMTYIVSQQSQQPPLPAVANPPVHAAAPPEPDYALANTGGHYDGTADAVPRSYGIGESFTEMLGDYWDPEDNGATAMQLAPAAPELSAPPKKELELTKLSISGLTPAEEEVVRCLFREELIDENPTLSPEDEQDQIELPRDDLSWGVKWVIIKVLSDRQRFAKVVSIVLRLSREQVQAFLEIYIHKFHVWLTWENHVATIPYADILGYALERRISVHVLLRESRPALPTDTITQQDKDRGVEFLESWFHKSMPGLVEQFKKWTSEDLLDFLPIAIEWELIQDGVDKTQIRSAVELGWLPKEHIENVERDEAFLSKALPESPWIYPWKPSPFFGMIKCRVRPSPLLLMDDEEHNSDAIQEAPEGGAPENPDLQDANTKDEDTPGTDNDRQMTPGLPALPGLGPRPTVEQRHLLLDACRRTFPHVYITHVRGIAVSTLVEQGRAALPHRFTYCPEGVFLTVRLPTFPSNAGQICDGAHGEAGDVAAEAEVAPRVHPPPPPRKNSRQKKAAANPMPNGAQDLGAPEMNAESENWSAHGAFIPDPLPADLNLFGPAPSRPNIQQPMLADATASEQTNATPPVPPALVNPAAELRHRLKTQYAKYLYKNSKNSRKEDSDDEEEEEDFNFVLPEPEKDEEYVPSGQKKKTARRTSTQKKKKNGSIKDKSETTTVGKPATEQGEDEAGPKEANTAAEPIQPSKRVTRAQASATNPETPVQTTPANSPASSGPPSSGRIKLVLKSSHASSSAAPTAQSSSKPASPTANNEEDSPARTEEPLFGISRRQHLEEEAKFAVISTRARFAQAADRIIKPPGKTVAMDMTHELGELHRLQVAFDSIQEDQKAQGAQDAKRAEFAGCADKATYAIQAEEAYYAVEVTQTVDGDGDMAMPDAE
ncbi:hypothetical protein FDECE_7697 [Fusarium decemcellulare]|nr:hypothetical protein FDECE_7697 [Fusarium decemcellulare]